jgi:hypothetical protein
MLEENAYWQPLSSPWKFTSNSTLVVEYNRILTWNSDSNSMLNIDRFDSTMMRNGCLTICLFKIPQDVLFQYEKLVRVLLEILGGAGQEDFVERIAIYLLNSLACQVEGPQKTLVGQLGAIQVR